MRPEKVSLIAILGTFLLFNLPAYGDEPNKPVQTAAAGESFEEVLKKIEAQKNEELKAMTLKLNSQLNIVIDEWIAKKSRQMNSRLNELVEQNWEKFALTQPVSPLHYDYYLRGYAYQKDKADVFKSDSLGAPYKAVARVGEKLYVEKYHSPNISNVDSYFFTVTGSITIELEYRQDVFVITDSQYRFISIENDCPQAIKRFKI